MPSKKEITDSKQSESKDSNKVTKETKTKETKETKDAKEKDDKNLKEKDDKNLKEKDVKNLKEAPKEVKKTIVKKVIEIEHESEDEDDDDEDESDNEQEDGDKKGKEKKLKKTFQELASGFDNISADIKTTENEINEIEKNLKEKEKKRLSLERERAKIFSQMGKTHEEEVRKALKERPKRKGNKDGGFNKEIPVPPKLMKYLGLENDIIMSRPKVMSMLNDKFKSEGLKEGQKTTLDAKAAKALGQEKGLVIEFTEFQTFLKKFYDEVNSVNTVLFGYLGHPTQSILLTILHY